MIKIGTILTLETSDDDEEIKRFRCRVVEQKGSSLYIDYPINTQTGRTDFFPKGTFLFAYFVGSDQSIYKFYTEIIDRKREKVPMLMLRFDQNKLKKIQRREYVRVDASLDVSISDPEGKLETFTTVTKDISGGGLAVVLPENIEIKSGTPFDLVIVLRTKDKDIDYIFTRAESIRIFELTKEAKQLLSMKFVDIYEQDRQHIIQYCFETQLKERRQALENKN
ncbi:MAG TPA: flagellar brake protein [Bacilli bacterium]|uniref:Cyclic di-GMP receptor DgrA n=1 Tax=Amphibacillus indicireducens TaxID=1076330 RepID=A0ABP7V7Y8_9BACI|nr:flagellar brake protein [Bacilli bacterium]